MEKRKHIFWELFFWLAAIIQLVMFTGATNVTTIPQIIEDLSNEAYSWSSWGSWSPCSKSCGGGVAVQERHCLPRPRNLLSTNVTTASPVIAVRVTRQTKGECLGVAKRYHECNTAPCPGGVRDMRAEQCSAYDRRPFRGRFYTWVPYIDVSVTKRTSPACDAPCQSANEALKNGGHKDSPTEEVPPAYRKPQTNNKSQEDCYIPVSDSPCILNCRPLGQHFYASLSLVADGTPCTKPGFRAICVQGNCKVVGRETVLAAVGSREVHCGRRLVSGLFSRPRLPLGYSYVTTVPRGACRLNVSEIVSSENYIALKLSNSSYIMNGEFAVSAPGAYEAAGTRFIYSRAAGLDNVFALGPTLHPVDIMVLYTQPNPSIKYEYFTELLPGEIETELVTKSSLPDIIPALPKHNRKHHNFDGHSRNAIGSGRFPDLTSLSKEANAEDGLENEVGARKYVWKILSYTQCSRSCGGGIQLGKYRCVEITSGIDKEVSQVYCSGSAPAVRRRRCGSVPCAPRWRSTAWSQCPQCGPATRTRIVGCVQDHTRGITKVNDYKCTSPKPPTMEICNIPDCELTKFENKRVIRPREHTDTFRDGPVYTVAANNTDLDIGPEYTFNAAAGWLYTEWTECVGWCVGGGIQTRGVRCADPSGCAPRKAPESFRSCSPKLTCELHDGQWFTGDWSPCSSSCKGKQVRGVLCIGNNGRHLREAACKGTKPEHERDCGTDCLPTWYFSDWGQCTSNCSAGIGVQMRSVVCTRDDHVNGTGTGSDKECGGSRPSGQRDCAPHCLHSTIPPDLSIESQKASEHEQTTYRPFTTMTTITFKEEEPKDCEDKLYNCALAVQARLCHYNYYVQNCCNSCKGR